MNGRRLLVAALILVGFASFASYRAPVPSVNEPQYLGKAKHFWEPDWCGGDFFLASADAHPVFYASVGALTRVLSLEETAWIGRLLAWTALALGWTSLAGRLLAQPLAPLWSAAFFLALQAAINLSGEWLIGGIEAKVFAYAALLAAIESACAGRARVAALALGAAVSFHPVVGIWGTLAFAAAAWFSSREETTGISVWRSQALAAALWLAAALPGLVPAVRLVADRPSPEIVRRADQIQVFQRLKHHLDPRQFPPSAYASYSALLVGWLVGRHFLKRNEAERFLYRFTLAAVAIAAVGFAIGFGPRWPGLMKFYPFRLADIFLPIAASMTAVGLLERLSRAAEGSARERQALPSPSGRGAGGKGRGQETFPSPPTPLPGGEGRNSRALFRLLLPAAGCVALALPFLLPGRIANAAKFKNPEHWNDFVEACRWIERNTSRDALFLTPKFNIGFKWYAHRAEFVTWKDCPQDAAGIVEWRRRLDQIERWRSRHFRRGFSEAARADLQARTQVDFILAWNTDPWRIEPLYRNGSLSVYAAK